MQRQNPLTTPLGILLTFLLLGYLVVMFVYHRGEMFSPGPLTALSVPGRLLGGVESHADLAHQCAACHQPLKTSMAPLCLECHLDIKAEIDAGEGLHARMPGVEKCFGCHKEHRGSDFDPTATARLELDHELLRFSLVHHQVDYSLAPLACDGCHQAGFSADQVNCVDCHAAHDPAWMIEHQASAGTACLACHDGQDRMRGFDHASTGFPLEEAHQQAACSACHENNQMTGLSAACESCHAEPSLHAGLFPGTCETCHTPAGWSPALWNGSIFDHAMAGFSLEFHKKTFAGTPMTCLSCHEPAFTAVSMEPCLACHSEDAPEFMAKHVQDFGENCLACHDGTGNLANFDHARFFPLTGAHAEVSCQECHVNQVFKGTSPECASCHSEPSIHAGVFGLQCDLCHTPTAWAPARLVSHKFPLDHGEKGEIPCQTCHVARYTEYTCDACHDPQEMRRKHQEEGIRDITNCIQCHPTGKKDEAEGGDD